MIWMERTELRASKTTHNKRTFLRSVSGETTAMWSSSVLRNSAKQTTVSEAPLATANSKQVSFSLLTIF